MIHKLSYLLPLIVILASCQLEQDWDGAPDIRAKVESEQKTRTSLSVDESGAGTIYWNPSDQIDVFFGTTKAQYTSQNASDAISATFKTSDSVSGTDVSSTNIWGLYPSNSSSSCNGSSITTTLTSTQYGVPNTFDKDIFPAVARSSSTDLQFYNVCGGIKFNLAYDDIKKITFRGNNNESIAGTISISFVSGVPKATVTSGVKEITLTPKSGTKFVKGADYYITLLPGTLSNGFTMTFTTTRGAVGMLNYTDKAVEIKRSFFSRKAGVDAYAAFADGRQPNNVIYYTTSDGSIVEPLLSYNGYAVEYGANIVSNEYVGGKGIITFNGDVTSIGYYAFHDQEKLTSIWLPESLTSIMDGAFADCSGLTSIDMPDTVAEIGKYAFSNCSGLTVMEIPGTVKKINSFSFQFCTNLTTVIIPNSVSIIGMYAFSNCTSLASVDIPDSVTEIWDGAFWHCSALNSIVIPSSVTSIDQYAFDGCTCLTSIEIPVSVTSIGNNPFSGCTGLSSITVASGNTVFDSRNNCNAIIESATNELIAGCGRTVIPGTVTGIGAYAFYRFSSLTSYEVPAWVSSIGSHAFDGCTSLTSIVDYAASSPSLGNNAFDNTDDCPIYVPMESVNAYKTAWSEYADRIQAMPSQNNVIYYTSASGQVVTPYKTDAFGANIVSNEYVGGRGVITFDGEVTRIGDTAFYRCSSLVSIVIPNTVTSIGNSAFRDTSLKSIEIPNSVTNLGNYALSFCDISSIVIPGAISSIGHSLLVGCYELKSIVVESSNHVFDSRNNCNAIINSHSNELISGCEESTIPDSVESIGRYAFGFCEGLKSIVIPHSVTRIGDHAFYYCSGLTFIEIPNSVTSIEDGAFFSCSSLTSIVIPNSVTSLAENPFGRCFDLATMVVESGNPFYDSRNDCNAIIKTNDNELVSGCKESIIPDSVTRIGAYSFNCCENLTSIVIPNSVTSIGSYAFRSCNLSSVIVMATVPPSLDHYAFDTNSVFDIFVPAESVNVYKSEWTEYADRIQAIPDTHEAVDLGLPSGVKWATCNVGASSPEEYGDYFAWGET